MRDLISFKPSRSRISLIAGLFHTLQGTWNLDRKLQSDDPTAPSGRCSGKATFTPTPPSAVIDSDGKLQLADAELLYHEQGEFEMATATAAQQSPLPLKFPFSRKYIWRLKRLDDGDDALTISVWFTKPGTNMIDYLFHQIDLPLSQDDGDDTDTDTVLLLHGTGGHLCVADFYSTAYSFSLSRTAGPSATAMLSSWSTLHEVRGPKKDQVIETKFTRA
ncbi:hypothetical protein A1O3_08815 [Capronia epimyces CBS 606.96]|uniref:DUF6314 domain-containing protein n=1 Tax=Capronia epimyces CBS 606.96 TaxID=1182542 RepID=W9XGE8_9EURO|nr:uncharacterized protein A1O3_08815 [Capronia epimyces CBS 606.96]EXJ79313.1 hypothetical protein A1O3_08815 [Capronia epimyces CBS 606.96]